MPSVSHVAYVSHYQIITTVIYHNISKTSLPIYMLLFLFAYRNSNAFVKLRGIEITPRIARKEMKTIITNEKWQLFIYLMVHFSVLNFICFDNDYLTQNHDRIGAVQKHSLLYLSINRLIIGFKSKLYYQWLNQ